LIAATEFQQETGHPRSWLVRGYPNAAEAPAPVKMATGECFVLGFDVVVITRCYQL
jgi:hypothetical protein